VILCACEASFVRLAVCLAPGAHFASTGPTKIVDLLNASDLPGVVDLQAPRKIW
jgi:hypothetical protein